MISVTIQASPDPLVTARKLIDAASQLERDFMAGLRDDVRVEAQQHATRGRPGLNPRSRHLERNITSQLYGGRFFGETAEIFVGVDLGVVPYARVHEFGGVIRPKSRRWLIFQIGGRWIRTKRVVMPKRSYLRPAVTAIATSSRLNQRLELTIGELERQGAFG